MGARVSAEEGGPRLAARIATVAASALFAVVLVPAAFGASTYTVTSNAGAPVGSCTPTACTLSDAITAANGDPGSTITFATAMAITLTADLPDVTAPVTIDGGIVPSKVGVTIDAGTADHGLVLAAGSGGSHVRGLAFVHTTGTASGPPTGAAVNVVSNGNTVAGNFFGLNAGGAPAVANDIAILVSGSGNTIGGSSTAGDGNVILGLGGASGHGIWIRGNTLATPNANVVQGNRVGVGADGTPGPGTGAGVEVDGATNTIVGVNAGPDELFTNVKLHPDLGNVVAGSHAGILIGAGSTGTIATGNFLGVDSAGATTSPNTTGIRVSQSSGNQIGPGNVSAHSDGNGVVVDAATGDRIVANSIFDNAADGILLQNGANHGIAAPGNVSVLDGTVTGTATGSSGQTLFLEFFRNESCDAAANGEGETYLAPFTVQIPEGKTSVDFSAAPGNVGAGDGITVTATDSATNDTSAFSDCATAEVTPSSAPGLDGTVASTPDDAVDLTAAGSSDWALWDHGLDPSTSSLTPTDTKANGGRQISDLTVVGNATTTTRNFGQFATGVPFHFGWSDGVPTASATGQSAGITAPQAGTGLSFTVPADTTQRTLKIWTSAHFANGTLTASLSDSSAPDKSWPVSAVAGQFTNTGENVPFVFTISYAAASADQHLTVTWSEDSSNNCQPACDDVVLYGAALGQPGVSGSLSSDQSVAMSGPSDPIAGLPLAAFEPTPPATPPLQINGLPINGLPINGLPINGLQINGLPINGLPINGLPINGLPLDAARFPGGWPVLLAGTSLADKPLQSITLQDVLDAQTESGASQALRDLSLADLDLSGSALGQVTVAALTLAKLPINGLPTELESTIETTLASWCASLAADAATACSPSGALWGASLFQLALAGAPVQSLPINGLPINGLPINGLPINGLPINGLSTSASAIGELPINGLQINGLQINGLAQINGLPINGLAQTVQDKVVDCTLVDCLTATLGDAFLAHAIRPGASLDDLDGSFGDLTLEELLNCIFHNSIYANTVTLGDIVGLLIKRADVPWESLTPRELSFFDTARPSLALHASFNAQGAGTGPATVKVTLPAGFDYDPAKGATLTPAGGEASTIADPTIKGATLTWHLDAVTFGTDYTLDFSAFSGSDVGPASASVTVTSGGHSATAATGFAVTDSFQGNDQPGEAPTVDPGEAVQMSALPTRGAVDYYRIPLPEQKGARVLVHLTNLAADYDLALYAQETVSVRTSATPGIPLQDGIAPDPEINLQGGPNSQLTPQALQDVPDSGLPLVQVSANRGTDDEDVGIVSPGGSNKFATVAVFGYNGASSPKPYTLRVTSREPVASTCAPLVLPHHGEGTLGSQAPGTIPSNVNTIILVNAKGIGDTYGTDAETNVMAKLTHLATQDSALGVSGVVVPVDAVAQAEYTTWNADPCDADAANAVANTIADSVQQLKQAHPTIKYVVFAGGDDLIPFFRVPDLTRIANETGFASQFGANAYQAALAGGNLLTDAPYLDTRPIPQGGRQLFVPDLVGGRLVETADDIAGAVTNFETANGTLASSTASVTGYDFVTDGAQAVSDALQASRTAGAVHTLLGPSWSSANLFATAFPSGTASSIQSWNGHYDNTRALLADGTSLLTTACPSAGCPAGTSDLSGPHALSGGIFFTMGCHAGFQTSDVVIGSPVEDWAQYFAQSHTGFVGNTGFGLGSTDGVQFSEELMGEFAANLDGSMTIGDALTQAKQRYYLSRAAFSSYDEKTLSEAELYGLPMFGVGSAPTAVAAGPTDPVNGATQSTSPSQGSLVPFPGGAQAAAFAATPTFTPKSGANGSWYTNGGQVQAPNYAPLQPFLTLPATRSGGLLAHGVVIDSLTSEDHAPFDPSNVRPTVDLSANEAEPQFATEAWPAKVPTLVSLQGAGGTQQSLNLVTGQFFTDSGTGHGVERLWTQLGGRVTYSTSTDFTPPTIDSSDAFLNGGTVVFSGHFGGTTGGVQFAQVVYDADNSGTWRALRLVDQGGGNWSGGTAFNGSNVQYFVEVCDGAGNCGYSSNKGRYFDAQPLQSSNGTITLAPDRDPGPGGYYTAPLTVTVTSSAPLLSVTLDGVVKSSPVTVAGDGVHIVEARDTAGHTATAVYLIDTSGPANITFTGIESKIYPVNDLPPQSAIGCTASDGVSGFASCVVTGYSAAFGAHTLTATATDLLGNQSTATLTYTVGLQSGDILPPVTAPGNDQVNVNATDLQVFKISSTIPLKFNMYLDGKRTTLLTTPPAGSVAKLTLDRVSSATASTDDATLVTETTSDSGGIFRFSSGQYQYNLKTKGYSAGKYAVTITVYAADGTTVLAASAKQYFILRS